MITSSWIDKLLVKHWSHLRAKVGLDMMPILATGERYEPNPAWKEYGCGHYGCVYATATKDVVCKITSDPSEISFVQKCIASGWDWPHGIVAYHALAVLDEERYRSRPVAVLWRQEAEKVGQLGHLSGETWRDKREELRFSRVLMLFRRVAHQIRESADPFQFKSALQSADDLDRSGVWDLVESHANDPAATGLSTMSSVRSVRKLAAAMLLVEVILAWMQNESGTAEPIGSALKFYLEQHIVLADVHLNNVGLIHSRDYPSHHPHWAIVDPGHSVDFSSFM